MTVNLPTEQKFIDRLIEIIEANFANGSFGRTDLPPGGNSQDLINSLKRLSSMNVDILAPGHMDVVNNGQLHIKKSYETAKV